MYKKYNIINYIYRDRWIPRPHSFMIQSPPVLGENALVKRLITPSGSWDIPLIRSSFSREEVDAILSIPIRQLAGDSIIWHFGTDGNYTVKSGYKLGHSIWTINAPSGSSNSGWWNTIWQIKVPPKVKSFLWKACKNWLPTAFNLAGRGVPTEMLCLGCSKRPETTSHALWYCETLKRIRFSCSFTAGPKWRDDVEFKDLFLFYKHVLCVEDVELLCIVWWRIWFMRNRGMHSISGHCLDEVVSWASSYLEDFKSARLVDTSCLVSSSCSNELVTKWTLSPVDTFKVNVDAAIQADKQLVGVGLIVRQSNGLVLVASAQCFTACFSPLVAEAVAILRGLQCAVSCGFYPVVLDSDAKWVVDLINSGNETQAEIGAIVEDILVISKQFNIPISFVPRAANMAAHVLANNGLRSCTDQVWYEEVPHWLESVCCLDSSE
ncbi:hypothetical protein Ddye_017112 [Dipteronia dyeriana]|uniref:RNase H type-1 domain-containing protein n=1 Tax=Dipteronia dyeriana TaxID=168575 RepID=A0AAD9X0P9_9ROSI|nr:hypothetical protein Ddye_017112 [Dipteronia dyeriana]